MLSTFLSIQRQPNYTGKPVCVVHLSFNSKMANLHRETRLCCPPFFQFKDGQLTQRNLSMLSTFLSIQRWPTYTEKEPVYVVHLSLDSKTANLNRETSLCCTPFFPFKEGQLTQRNPSMLSTFIPIQRRPTYTKTRLCCTPTPGSPKWSLSFWFPHQNPVYANPIPQGAIPTGECKTRLKMAFPVT